MQTKRIGQLLLILALGISGLGLFWSTTVYSQTQGMIDYGIPVSGIVADRLGQEWGFHGCTGDVVTVTMASAQFNPFLDLYGPSGRQSLAQSDNPGTPKSAKIQGYSLVDTGDYTIVAAGSSVRDRGAYSLSLTSGDLTILPTSAVLHAGETVTGTVRDRLGEEWSFRGCAGEVVTITMQSTAFNAYLELYGSHGREALTKDDNSGGNNNAQIANYPLPETGIYTVIALGSTLRERGGYTLQFRATTTQLTSTSASATTLTSTPTPASNAVPSCKVTSSTLNLRPGPGTVYSPPLGALAQGAEVRPQARDQSGAWLQVRTATGQVGWVSASAQYVACNNIDIRGLPIGLIPPTPTLPPTPLPTATPTQPAAQQPALPKPEGIVIQAPGVDGDLRGNLYTNPRNVNGSTDATQGNTIVFRNQLYLEYFVFDPKAGDYDGAGIDYVEFNLSCPNGNTYTRQERNARYCMFGGGEPNCNVIRLEVGAAIGDQGCVVEQGSYSVDISVVPKNNRRQGASRNLTIELQLDGGSNQPAPSNPSTPPTANLVQIGPGSMDSTVSNALVFQVEAYAPDVGNSDGDGIKNIDLWIDGPDGKRVYRRTENNAHYCAFGGGEPDCTVFDLGRNDHWPDGPEIQAGLHTLRWRVNAKDGRQVEGAQRIEINR